METNELPFLWNVGLMMTYRCTIACPHCIVEAGPHRKEEVLSTDVRKWINGIHRYRDGIVRGISLTGGEPFYNMELLRDLSDYASLLGLIVTIVTNAYWAKTEEIAFKILNSLHGIKMISLSTDVNHQKFIPLDNIRNAVHAAEKLHLSYNIAVTADNKATDKYKELFDEVNSITSEENIRFSITMPFGRAERRAKFYSYKMSSEPDYSACSMAGCPIVFPNGDVIACIGPPIVLPRPHPLYLGNLHEESIDDIFDRAEMNSILHALRVWGPGELVTALKEKGHNKLLPQEYIEKTPCDVCVKLFTNKDILRQLARLADERDFIEKIAYARIYYLDEPEMLFALSEMKDNQMTYT